MDTRDTIRTFVDFYRERGHRRITGSSLLPPQEDGVLFTTSGMHPLTPYLEGRPHPLGRRLVNVQRCLRTTDLDEVGDERHLTVFEMLGTWSLGDYDGSQSLRWDLELLRDGFGIEPGMLHVTVFGGDERVGPDTQSLRTWQELGLPVELTAEENWWGPNGPTGVCGPDSEVFVWRGDSPPQRTPGTDERWVEVWNHVLMRHHRDESGELRPSMLSPVDTGMGLERLLMVLQGKRSVFECDVFEPWMRLLPELWTLGERDLRVVCDHLRSSVVVLGDGVRPSNTGRGYVLRRLLRRTMTTLWSDDPSRSLSDLPVEPVEDTLGHFQQGVDPRVVREQLLEEERRFRLLIDRGRTVVSRHRMRGPLGEDEYRYLHDTHGLPRELVDVLLKPGDDGSDPTA